VVRFQAEAADPFLLHEVQTGSGAHTMAVGGEGVHADNVAEACS